MIGWIENIANTYMITNTNDYHLLLPANAVCEGNVFTGVCLSTGECKRWGGYVTGEGVCMAEGACVAGGTCMAGGVHGGGACVAGEHAWWGCAWQGACVAGEMATAAYGTHPTGMHSC